jgi:hypothetical protein
LFCIGAHLREKHLEDIPMSSSNYWQLVFNQSRVNGAEYFGDQLPCNSWDWPKNTFLQRRLSELKKQRWDETIRAPQRNRQSAAIKRKRYITQTEESVWLSSASPALRVEEH